MNRIILELTKTLLPNSTINEVFGCYSVTDMNGDIVGYVDGYFYLNEDYKHGRIIYERFIRSGVEVKVYSQK